MILSRSIKKRVVFALTIFLLSGTFAFAKKAKLEGVVVGSDGKKVKKAIVQLLSDDKVVEKAKTGRKGDFKFKVKTGDYVLTASHDDFGTAEMAIALVVSKNVGEIVLSMGSSAPDDKEPESESSTAESATTEEQKTDGSGGGCRRLEHQGTSVIMLIMLHQ